MLRPELRRLVGSRSAEEAGLLAVASVDTFGDLVPQKKALGGSWRNREGEGGSWRNREGEGRKGGLGEQ